MSLTITDLGTVSNPLISVTICNKGNKAISFMTAIPDSTDYTKKYGVHGYDNDALTMRPFFIAHGPKFKEIGRASCRERV